MNDSGPILFVFGFENESWLSFKEYMADGDELWTFSSPEETWKNLAGRAGLCIVRNGEIVAATLTEIN